MEKTNSARFFRDNTAVLFVVKKRTEESNGNEL